MLAAKFFGLLLTAFAISLGAPFWFELLQKLVSIRKSVAAKRAEDKSASKAGGTPVSGGETDSATGAKDPEPAYSGPMAGFAPAAATIKLGNAYWLANAAKLAYETDKDKLMATINSWGMQGHFFEARVPGSVDTQGFVAADGNAVIVAFRGTEPTQLEDIFTDLKIKPTDAHEYGAGQIHTGFKEAIDAAWPVVEEKVLEMGSARQPVWFCGHSLGGALAVLAASRYEKLVEERNANARAKIDTIEADAEADIEKIKADANLDKDEVAAELEKIKINL